MQIYDFTVAANTQRQLDAPGTYFYYYAGSAGGADQTITLRGVSSGLRIVLKNGQSLRLPKGQAPETSWYIGNYANAGTIVGTVIVGNGEIQDNRIQGAVEVINGGLNRSLAASAFYGGTGVAAGAAQIACVQLWNNAAAGGKNLVLENVTASCTAVPNALVILDASVALTTIFASSPNKYLGQAASAIAQIRTDIPAAIAGTKIMNLGFSVYEPKQFPFAEPIVIPPQRGITVAYAVAGAGNTYANFEHYEQ